MSIKKALILAGILVIGMFVLAACAGAQGPVGLAGPAGPVGPTGPAGPAGTNPSAADLACTQCHNDTTMIDGPETSWSTSVHATGSAFAIAADEAGCTGCHTGVGFSDRMAAGITDPSQFVTVYANPTRIDCRACHNIHTTYTKDDFSLKTVAAVPMFAVQGATFDGGSGNLCANCHQARAVVTPPDADGMVNVSSTHWGPHHGPQAEVMLGVGGAGAVAGTASPHYSVVKDTCVACHMGGDDANHTYTPQVAYCQTCHPNSTDFDMNGAVTALETKITQLKSDLTTAGLLDANGAIVVGKYPAAQADALWNYLLIGVEDKSNGVHNMPYANALMDASIAAFK